MGTKKRIWEVAEHYFCPIVGFCLSNAEQKMLLRKCSKGTEAAKRKLEGIDLHEFFVMGISKDTSIARRVERYLEIKYAREMCLYAPLGYREWLAQADTLLSPDTYGAYIWISAMYKAFPLEQAAQVYGKIHMYSHQLAVDLKACRLNLQRAKEYNAALDENHKQVRVKLKAAEDEVVRLDNETGRLQRECTGLARDLAALREEKGEVLALRDVNTALAARIEEQTNLNLALRHENNLLRKSEETNHDKIGRMLGEFDEMLNTLKQQSDSCEQCDRVDLCRRRVLVVGGLERMQVFYRELVESLGGEFDYNNGQCGNGDNELTSQILRADIVLCPVDINSHSACLEVKRTCKKGNKPFHMLRKSSISSVYATLLKVAASQ
jgi:hypothetical protein